LSLSLLSVQANVSNDGYTVLGKSSSIYSSNNDTVLSLSEDGNAVLSNVKTGAVYWSTNAHTEKGASPYQLIMRSHGNLELIDSNSRVFWSSNTAGSGCAPFSLTVDHASIIINDCSGEQVWISESRGISMVYNNKHNNNDKRTGPTNPCYEEVVACTNTFGETPTNLVAIAGYLEDCEDLETCWTNVQAYIGVNIAEYFIYPGSNYYVAAAYRHAFHCTCLSGEYGTFSFIAN